MKTFKLTGCNGSVVVIVALTLIVSIAVVGLAIDSGRAYGVKAKLNAAVDAAAIAATKALSKGESDSFDSRCDEARQTAKRYFYGNYPNGYFGSSPEFDPSNIEITPSLDGNIVVKVPASAEMPTTFMRVLGFKTLNVSALAQVTRQAVDIAFVVDNTTSLTLGTDVTNQVKAASKYFVSKFIPAYDRLALINYAFGANVAVGIRGKSSDDRGFDDDAINYEIDHFTFKGDDGSSNYTNSSEGFWCGLNELREIPPDNRSNLRVIVFFTDGAPNTFASKFNFKSPVDPHIGSIRSSDGSTGTPAGLWKPDSINVQFDFPYDFRSPSSPYTYGVDIYNQLHATHAFPQYYNAHGDDGDNFLVLNSSHPLRPVTQYNPSGTPAENRQQLYTKVNRVARNLLEDIAAKARQEGIYVFTLGLGSRLTMGTGPPMKDEEQERGEDLLVRMANLDDADGSDIIGEYCYAGAETQGDAEENLFNCYDRLSSAILRLTM